MNKEQQIISLKLALEHYRAELVKARDELIKAQEQVNKIADIVNCLDQMLREREGNATRGATQTESTKLTLADKV